MVQGSLVSYYAFQATKFDVRYLMFVLFYQATGSLQAAKACIVTLKPDSRNP